MRRSFSLAAALIAVIALIAACGRLEIVYSDSTTTTTGAGAGGAGGGGVGASVGGGGWPTRQLQSIAFDPPSATLRVGRGALPTATFVLKAIYNNGDAEEVSAESLQFDRPDLASMKVEGAAIVLSAGGDYGGTGALHGIYQGREATATLTVNVHVISVVPGADPSAIAALDGAQLPADPALTALLYPYDATVFPQGLTSPLLMWDAPSAADTYKVHYEEQHYTFDGYYPAVLPGSARAPQQIWDKLVASSAGGPLSVELSRWDAATSTAYTSAKQTWSIAPASLRGAIYYWTTSKGGQMARIRPGGSWEALNSGACMGCHAVSSDGSTLVAAWEGKPTNDGSNDDRAWVSFDLPDVTVRTVSTYFAGNVAVNNDGTYVVFGTQTLKLANTTVGTAIPDVGLDTVPLMPGMDGLMTPAFSPDGTKLAAVEGAGSWYHNLVGGRLAFMEFDAATQMFSGYTGLAPASDFPAGQRAIAYPTFSPDSKWIAFHVGDYATGCDVQGCNDAATQIGSLYMQSTSGTPPVELATLAHGAPKAADHNRAFEPTFNPIERGGYFWVVFTSMRDWGNRITGTPNNGKKRLWVAAIDKDPQAAADPSHPPFFLEGQDESTTNMRGFWALSACIPTEGGGGCQAGFECCSGFCDKGECVTPQDFACVGVGGVCGATTDCCNDTVVACVESKCTPDEPR